MRNKPKSLPPPLPVAKVEKPKPKPKPKIIEEEDNRPILGYWDIRGLAQAIRYQLIYLGVDFIDHHLAHTEDVNSR